MAAKDFEAKSRRKDMQSNHTQLCDLHCRKTKTRAGRPARIPSSFIPFILSFLSVEMVEEDEFLNIDLKIFRVFL